MSVEGQIHIRLDPGSVESVEIRSSRPQQVTELLQGLEPQQLQHKIPMLYALCGRAQWLAATRALQAATVDTPDSDCGPLNYQKIEPHHQRAVVIEALQEYLWRFLIDLPQRLHKQPALSVFAPLHKSLARLASEPQGSDEIPFLLDKLDCSIKTELLGMTVAQWQALDSTGKDNWLDQYPVDLPTWLRELRKQLQQLPDVVSSEQQLPDPVTTELLQRLGQALGDEAGFGSRPNWNGRQPETGAYSYQQQNPWLQALSQRGFSVVLLRMLARVFEVLRLRDWLHRSFDLDDAHNDSAATPADNCWLDQLSGAVSLQPNDGLGWVRTARGLLLHRLQMDQGKIVNYAILAPTEWNFHPQGPLAQGLERWLAVPPSRLADWVGLQVLSLDPCVQYQFEVKSHR